MARVCSVLELCRTRQNLVRFIQAEFRLLTSRASWQGFPGATGDALICRPHIGHTRDLSDQPQELNNKVTCVILQD